MEDGARVKECLYLYERASVIQRHEIYLGLPTISLRSKRLQFQYLVERVVKKTEGWGHKYFSSGGNETLIKAVIKAIPTYAINCFRIPKAIYFEIERECAKFWWGVENGKRKIHWKTWDLLCKPKVHGGMSFRRMEDFNRALLAKQVWRLIRFPDSLASRILKGRYFKHGEVLKAALGSNPSYIWRSIFWRRASGEGTPLEGW
ncbi:putative mitochondrial protein AtMg00310 [Primulina tabacum]|uniref:putative mitochondrial protein AtMg00310 n=1 Tax=Primulina tabacum TaxID=48773 RepID=UPI003F5A7423